MELQPASFVLGGLCSAAAAYAVHKLLAPAAPAAPAGSAPLQKDVPQAMASGPAAAQASPAEPTMPAAPLEEPAPLVQGESPRKRAARLSRDVLNDAAMVTMQDTLIIVGYQLPLNVSRGASGEWTIVWDHDRTLNKMGLGLPAHCIYVGCISIAVSPDEEDELEHILLEQFGCVVVFLKPALKEKYYDGFCRSYLSPIMHNQMKMPRAEDPFQDEQWRAYCQVNQLFATKVMEVYEPNYLIWVHDYHLLLLPSCILRKHRTAHIGLFLHSPFPASDVFKTIAVRDELLRAMLNADLVGFLLFEYTRNFLTCCKRMLGLNYEFKKGGFLGLEYDGRHVMLQVSTFGISPELVQHHMASPPTDAAITNMLAALERKSNGGAAPVVVAGVDFLDRLKGVALKLLAWEALLTEYPKYQKGHIMVQVCLGSRNQNGLAASPEIRAEIMGIADRINAAFPGAVHVEIVSFLSASARTKIWEHAHVHLCTAIREAVNTMPLEYVYTRHQAGLSAGVLVLSEFTGFARVLNGALRVNPFSQQQLVENLDLALEMAPAERVARGRKDLIHTTQNTMEVWARRFIVDLKAHQHKKRDEDFVSVGFGLASFRMVGMGAGFKSLDTQETVEAYQRSSRRALLLDWGGTLTPGQSSAHYDTRDDDVYAVPPKVIEVLTELCADPRNHVMILSGLGKDKVASAFAAVPNLSLAVEHGFTFRLKSGPWQQLVPGVDTSWREVAESVMLVYAARTNGAFVQKKGSSILWNFGNSDPEFGTMMSREVQTTLQNVLGAFSVVLRTGKGYVEACLSEVDKGVMAARFTEMCSADEPLDFILCIGDDSTDELMFGSLHAKYGKGCTAPKLITSTVGRKPSGASNYVGDHSEVVELLDHFLAASSATGRASGR